MTDNSIITDTKIKILKHGVKFNPLDMFTKHRDISKYKTKKIKSKPTIIGMQVYDMANEVNIIPAELVIKSGERESIVKLRYNPESPLEIKLDDDALSFYESDEKVDVDVSLVLRQEVLNRQIPIKVGEKYTCVGDYIDIVGIDRISILFFEGCYNWNCGKACKFCDLHPKAVDDLVVKPTVNNLDKYGHDVRKWWSATRKNYFDGIKYSMQVIEKDLELPHNHLFFMAGNLISSEDVWNVAEDLIFNMTQYLDLSKYDTYLNIAPHDNIGRLKRIKDLGIKQVQYNLEIANKEIFEATCPGKIKYDLFVEKLIEATRVFGSGNVRSNFVFGLQDKDGMLKEIERLASLGIVADYSVFQPKKNTPFQDKEAPDFDDVIDFSNKLADIYTKYDFKPIFCTLSSRSSVINEIYEDRHQKSFHK